MQQLLTTRLFLLLVRNMQTNFSIRKSNNLCTYIAKKMEKLWKKWISTPDKVEKKYKNIHTFLISIVIFHKFHECALSNKLKTFSSNWVVDLTLKQEAVLCWGHSSRCVFSSVISSVISSVLQSADDTVYCVSTAEWHKLFIKTYQGRSHVNNLGTCLKTVWYILSFRSMFNFDEKVIKKASFYK